ncbi:SDR family oxidoreductase [Hansschlegelia zhihuaiae]|uniref:SDR family oxidoreductase n=1 Tax=Hansschlegelia zhihuaiae TaxID=405005 RepID=A0A4Q0MJ41_9HYPH|nr:SDR family oxidoreductase [Hansschlegelia zhihuaiae]RXF73564.1 SDR family oxidoreductase [Hansschlegelia zhihuaiae]
MTSGAPAPVAIRPKGGALVTGAGRRIGAEIARALGGAGYAVAVHCRHSATEANGICAEIVAEGGRASVLVADLAEPLAPRRLVAQAAEAVGPLVALVNCASSFEPDAVGGLDAELWDLQMAVNLRAPVFLTEAFAAQAPDGADACVVNIIDQRVLKPTPSYVSYTLSKSALMTATITLAQALAPKVRVAAIGPGPTLANVRQSDADFARQAAATPLGRGPSPREIADAVLYLLGARSVTGCMIPVDAGQHIAWKTADAED